MSKKIDDIYESLKTSKKKYMVEIDMEGRFVGWSEDALELIGYKMEEMEDLTVFDVVADLDLLLEAFEERPEAESQYDLTIIHKSGKRMSVKVYPEVIMKDGEIYRVKCVFHLI
jgi:PAS domain S-box-containing protein